MVEFGDGEVIDMDSDSSLLLFVDVKEILHHKVELKDTKSYDSIEGKKEQVGNNIIKNSWVLYNNIINNKINEEIDNRVPSLENIECNENNEKELVTCKVISDRKTITYFSKYVIEKCGDIVYVNKELGNVLNDICEGYFKKQQTTTKTINFNGRTPKTFVLKRLELMGAMMEGYESVVFTERELKQIISDVLDKPDVRTSKAYYDCFIDYSKQIGGVKGGMFVVRFNMRGFADTVRAIMARK